MHSSNSSDFSTVKVLRYMVFICYFIQGGASKNKLLDITRKYWQSFPYWFTILVVHQCPATCHVAFCNVVATYHIKEVREMMTSHVVYINKQSISFRPLAYLKWWLKECAPSIYLWRNYVCYPHQVGKFQLVYQFLCFYFLELYIV